MPEHKEWPSPYTSPYVIYSKRKSEAGLCELYPFLFVAKQSWFTDQTRSKPLVKSCFPKHRFGKQPDGCLGKRPETTVTPTHRLRSVPLGCYPNVTGVSTPPRVSCVTSAFFREWLYSRRILLLDVPATACLASSEGFDPKRAPFHQH